MPTLIFTNNSNVVNLGSNKVAKNSGIKSVRDSNRKVKNLSKIKNIEKSSKSTNIKQFAKFKKPAKVIINRVFKIEIFISEARVAFT